MELVEKAKEYIEKLEILRDNLGFDNEENYNKILEIANNFDNDFEDIYLTDIIYDNDFITEDEAEYKIREYIRNYGLDRVRRFINTTTDSSIYKLDMCNDLQNIEEADFETLIDNMIYEIKNNLAYL